MSVILIPSVPRAMLLPSLDTHRVVDEDEEPVDPTPPGSHWLFRPLPFISRADLQSETVTIHNPSAFRATSLSGYTLCDRQRLHAYAFPQGYAIPARSSIKLYCCPGRKLSERELEALPRTALLWKNQDGSLRRKEVLNDNGDAVVLYDNHGKEIAALDLPGLDDEPFGGGYGSAVAGATSLMRLPGVKLTQVLALRTLTLILCYLRVVSILVSASFVMVHPDVFCLFTLVSHVLDVLCRWASSQPGATMDEFGVVLATLGDRLSALVLVGSLVVLDGKERNARMFGGILALDIAANWLQLSVASAAGGFRPLAGVPFVKETGTAPDFTTHLMVHFPIVLTAFVLGLLLSLAGRAVTMTVVLPNLSLVSLGNEAFLLWSYLLASARLAHGLQPMLASGACQVARWSFIVDEGLYCEGGDWSDGFVEVAKGKIRVEVLGELGSIGGFHVVWKAIWWTLKLCCVSRQVLSCIQALIAMSTLSSGVIADAAGQDLQRRRSTGEKGPRGRSVGRDNGGRRARSRSRVR